jgi:hypothetical protein
MNYRTRLPHGCKHVYIHHFTYTHTLCTYVHCIYIHTYIDYITNIHTFITLHTYIHSLLYIQHFLTLHTYIHTHTYTHTYIHAYIHTLHYITLHYINTCGPGSVVGIATAYGLEGPGIESRCGRVFRTCPDRPWGPPSLLYNWYWVFPEGKVRPVRDADPSPPSSVEVKNKVELYLYSL